MSTEVHEFRLEIPGKIRLEIAGDQDFVREVYSDARQVASRVLERQDLPPLDGPKALMIQARSPLDLPPTSDELKLPAAAGAPMKQRRPARPAGRGPALADAAPTTRRRRGGVRFSCDQKPGQTFTTVEAAELAGATPAAVSLAVRQHREVKGFRFRVVEETASPERSEDPDHPGRSMPVNPRPPAGGGERPPMPEALAGRYGADAAFRSGGE